MIYKILLFMAISIFIMNYYVGPTFFNVESSDTGLFTGLMMLCIVIAHILRREKV